MTNKEYIQALTTDKLCKFLRHFQECACCTHFRECENDEFHGNNADCNRGIKDWLDEERIE